MSNIMRFSGFKPLWESETKTAAANAEALLDLASEYADINADDIRPQLFTTKSEALDIITAAVTALEGAKTAMEFREKAKSLLNL